MTPGSTGWSKAAWARAAWALAAALLAVNVYRAATQSITTDEAFTFNLYVDAPIDKFVQVYDANHHVLNSLLMRASAASLGVSEFSVRLPALVGGALYLAMAVRLALLLFGPGPLALLCVALLGQNPFILDFLSIARGYALALGFLLCALDAMLRYLLDRRQWRLYCAACALALAVAANLTFAVPGAALAGAFAAAVWRDPRGETRWTLVDHFIVPGVALAFVLLVLPLSHAGPEKFYYGAGSLLDAVESLLFPSLRTLRPGSPAQFTSELMTRYVKWFDVLAAVLFAGAGVAFRERAPRWLIGGTMWGSLAVLAAAHHALGVPYPADRTGIYWVPLFTLAGVGLVARYGRVRIAGLAVAALCLAQFLLLFRVNGCEAWLSDAGTRGIVNALRKRENGARRVRLAATWTLEPGLNFYRRMYRLDWLDPVGRDGPADYRVLVDDDRALVEKLRLTVLYRDALSGAVLAK